MLKGFMIVVVGYRWDVAVPKLKYRCWRLGGVSNEKASDVSPKLGAGNCYMYWVIACLIVLGAACGAVMRLMIFVGVLFAAAVIVVAVSVAYGGVGAALLSALVAVVTLQVGYVVGIVLRAAIPFWCRKTLVRAPAHRRRHPLVRSGSTGSSQHREAKNHR
jgi:hypothetical protein